MNTKYDFRTAIELPIGGNCRYFFNNSTLISKCDSTSEIVYSNQSFVSWHFVDNANCKFTITGNRFNYRFSFDSDVTKCNVLFTNNSHKEDNVFANATVMQFNNVKE